MTETALLAGGCFWGEKSVGRFSQDHASYFVNEMKQSSDMVYSSCKEWRIVI